MPSIDIYNTTTKKTTKINLKKEIFEAKINQPLMAQAVKVYLSNQRQAPARTKSRGEVKVTKQKVWRQKGTGRARHGSRNAPIFVGGAKAHGPTGEQNYKLNLSKKMKRASLFSALTKQLKDKKIMAITGLEKLTPKTKKFNLIFTKLTKTPKKILLVTNLSSIKRATNNLPYINSATAKNLTTYHTLNANKIIFTKESLKALEEHYVF
ncbi:MAG: 50S ribosomal protein L4 [Candidatus Beckwithbacteria bacterium]|nr:50S ribosomal protein L4 [Patescibacteria group bacterium]